MVEHLWKVLSGLSAGATSERPHQWRQAYDEPFKRALMNDRTLSASLQELDSARF
jgi:hypothetical protein